MNLRKFCNRNKCTCWFDKLGKLDWTECCQEHDDNIILGRTKNSFEADRKLWKCVAKRSKIMATIMYIGVTPMSYIFWKLYRSGKLN